PPVTRSTCRRAPPSLTGSHPFARYPLPARPGRRAAPPRSRGPRPRRPASSLAPPSHHPPASPPRPARRPTSAVRAGVGLQAEQPLLNLLHRRRVTQPKVLLVLLGGGRAEGAPAEDGHPRLGQERLLEIPGRLQPLGPNQFRHVGKDVEGALGHRTA